MLYSQGCRGQTVDPIEAYRDRQQEKIRGVLLMLARFSICYMCRMPLLSVGAALHLVLCAVRFGDTKREPIYSTEGKLSQRFPFGVRTMDANISSGVEPLQGCKGRSIPS